MEERKKEVIAQGVGQWRRYICIVRWMESDAVDAPRRARAARVHETSARGVLRGEPARRVRRPPADSDLAWRRFLLLPKIPVEPRPR